MKTNQFYMEYNGDGLICMMRERERRAERAHGSRATLPLPKGESGAVSEDAGPVEARRRDLVARVVVEHLVERVDRGAVEVIHPLVHGHVPHLVRVRGMA